MAFHRRFGSNSFLNTHGMPIQNQRLSQAHLDAPLYRRAITDNEVLEGECVIGISAIKRINHLNDYFTHYFLANFEYTLKYKENNHTSAAVALKRQNNITYSLVTLLEHLQENPRVMTQPIAWHLKRVLEATLITDAPEALTTRLKKVAKPFHHKVLALVPDPDHNSHCATCGPIPQLERKLALRDRREQQLLAENP